MKRRGNGEGTIKQRRDGRWEARYIRPNGTRASVYGRTRQEVAEKLGSALEARRKGLSFITERTTVGEYLAKWLEGQRIALRRRTWIRYESAVRVHLAPVLGRISLVRLQPHHLEALYADRLKAGAAPRSVRNIHMVLRRALGQAERRGVLPRNVATLVDKPKASTYEVRTLSEEQTRAFLAAAAGERLAALYVLALTTGMRQGELLALRWRDVDLDNAAVLVRSTLERGPEGFRLVEPKTTKSRRRIELGQSAIDALRAHRAGQLRERVALGPAWDDLDLVFPNEIGRPIDSTNLTQRSFRKLLAKAGLPRIRFHDLRHTAATLMLGRGVHPKVASERLGHAQVAITLDLYSHVTPTMQREAAAIMDAVVGGRR